MNSTPHTTAPSSRRRTLRRTSAIGRMRPRILGAALAAAALAGTLAAGPALAATPPAPTGTDGSPAAGQNGRGPVPVYQAAGTEISGGETLSAATEVEPGLYRDTFEKGSVDGSEAGSARFYLLPAMEDGERLHAAAVLAIDTQEGEDTGSYAELHLDFLNLEGDNCGSNGQDSARYGGTGLPVVAAGTSDPMDPENSFGCFANGTGQVAVKVERSGEWQAETPIPVELRFWVEDPVDESQLSEASSGDLPPESVTTTGEPTTITAGTNFATAAELTPDQVYAAEIRPTEVQYFKVPVEFGQRLNHRLSTPNNEDASVRSIDASTFTPLLRSPRMLGGSSSLTYNSVGAVATQNTAVAVSADEYESNIYGTLRHAGDYYIVVGASEDRPRREGSQPFRYELAVTVTGEPGGTSEWIESAPVAEQVGEAGGSDARAAGGNGGGWFPTGTELGALLGGVGLGAVLVGLGWFLLHRRARG